MFKVHKTEYVNKTFRMPRELVQELESVAQQKDVSLNQLVTQCCQYALDHLDTEALYAYSKDEPVGRNAGWKPHESLLESSDILHLVFLDQPSVWAVERRDDRRLMGSVGLITDSARQYGSARSLGYALGVDYWGQGYMTEAVRAVLRFGFEQMALDLISATCYPDNPASRRVLEKCGFAYEGTLHRAELLYNGEIKDHLHFYLTHEAAAQAGL